VELYEGTELAMQVSGFKFKYLGL